MFIFLLFRVKCISTIFFILFSLPTSIKNSRKFCAPRAQNLRALGRRALRKPQNIVASLHRVVSSLYMQKSPSDAPRSRKSSAKLARNHCKIPRILARRGQRSCLKSASMRCVIQTTSLQLLNGSAVRPNAKKWRVWHRCHANFVPKSREKIAKFPDFRRAARTKTA